MCWNSSGRSRDSENPNTDYNEFSCRIQPFVEDIWAYCGCKLEDIWAYWGCKLEDIWAYWGCELEDIWAYWGCKLEDFAI